MRIAIVTNLTSRGLKRDCDLLRQLSESLGHDTEAWQYDQPQQTAVDLLIFCEVVIPGFISLSKQPPWLIANPEFLFQHDFKTVQTLFGRVICKTHEAYRICSKLFLSKAVYTGFLAADKFNPSIKREARVLHIAGSSRIKNTQAVVDAWKWMQNGKALKIPLTIVSDWMEQEDSEFVTVVKNISDEELSVLQNSHKFHAQPSGTEGFSHVLHEAMSVNAAILTTDAAPMNELQSVYLIPSTGKSYFNQAEVHEVSAIDIHTAARELSEIPERFQSPRDEFLRTNDEFKQVFADLLAECEPRKHGTVRFNREFEGQLRVAFLGNFRHSFCTESDLAYEMERLGHEVIRVQEDIATLPELHSAIIDADIFFYVHTHGWGQIADEQLFEFLELLKIRGIPSVGFHLDRYWGIPEREVMIGKTPFWKCSHVFTADGGNDEKFWARGVNHFYLPPAVVSRGVHGGFPRTDLRSDVAFVGSVDGYHEAYPFRRELIRFLQGQYRVRFRIFQGVREAELNDIYASCLVIAGDSIFVNDRIQDRYFSDRVPETMGRGGVLVHAEVKGLDWPGLTIHRPGDLVHMAERIDALLASSEERRFLRDMGMEFVRKNHTYSNRVQQIIKVVFDAK